MVSTPNSKSFLIFLSFSLLLAGAHSTITICETDEFCQEKFNSKYVCDSLTKKCNRAPLISPLSFNTILGIFLIFISNLVSFSMGVTANGVIFPILVLIFDYIAKDSLSTLKMSNIMVAVVNCIFVLLMRNKNDGNRLYVDFEMVLFLIPLVLVGSMIGCLSFVMLPPVFTYSIILVVMVILTVRNFFKMNKMRREIKEKEMKMSINEDSIAEVNKSTKSDPQSTNAEILKDEMEKTKHELISSTDSDNSTKDANSNESQQNLQTFKSSILSKSEDSNSIDLSEIEKDIIDLSTNLNPTEKDAFPSLFGLLWEQKFYIFLVIVAFSVMVIGNLGKGSKDKISIFDFEQCSAMSIGFYIFCMIPLVLISYFAFIKLRRREKRQNQTGSTVLKFDTAIKIGICSLTGGFISTMGVSGSLFISSFLILLGVEPIVVKCTMSFMILFMSMNNSFQFFYMGYFDWKNILIFALVSIAGCLLANLIIKKELAKANSDGVNLIISTCCFIMTLALCFVLPISSFVEYVSNVNFFNFSTIC